MVKDSGLNRQINPTELIACSKCGKMVDKMHLAPAFITICPECYVRENPHIDKY